LSFLIEIVGLNISKKDRIKKLAEDIDATGIIPTVMICGLIVNKLGNYFSNHHYITQVLDAKYKNQNQSNAALNHRSNNSNSNNNQHTKGFDDSGDDITTDIIDYGKTFDIADCTIEQWDTYSDDIKKNWVIRLIEEKRELQREILELQQQIVR
jgi:hypothetical protein